MDIDKIRQTYALDSDYPQNWSDGGIDANIAAVSGDSNNRDVSQYALIQQLMSSLNSSGSIASDERDPLGSTDSISSVLFARGIDVDSNPNERAKYMLSSTKFDPRLFLKAVHNNASFEELQSSLRYLKQTIDSQDSNLRTNVDNDYEHYVTAKRMLDGVMPQFGDSREDTTDQWGIGAIKNNIDAATSQYTVLNRPLEDHTYRLQRYENSLAILRAYKFLFDLPNHLQAHIQANDHEEFVRDSNLAQEQLAGLRNSNVKEATRLADNIEARLTKIQQDYRSKLWKQLFEMGADSNYSQFFPKILSLTGKRNPAFAWIEHQLEKAHEQIFEHFDKMKLNTNLQTMQTGETKSKQDISPFVKTLADSEDERQLQGILDTLDVTEAWISLVDLFNGLQSLMDRISVLYRECNNLLRTKGLGPELQLTDDMKARVKDRMDKNIELLVNQLVDFLTAPLPKHLSATIAAQHAKEDGTSLAYIPINTNSLSASKYLGQIVDILRPMRYEIVGLIGDAPILKRFDLIQNQFVRTICDCWVRDCHDFGAVQSWSSAEIKGLKRIPEYFQKFQGCLIYQLRYIMGSDRSALSDESLSYVHDIFPTALSICLKSLYSTLVESERNSNASELQPEHIDQDSKVLVTNGNFYELRDEYLPALFALYRSSFRQNTDHMQESVLKVISHLSTNLFDLYTRKKKFKISQIISQELVLAGHDWTSDKDPERISSYMYESLLTLVDAHSKLTELCPKMIVPVVNVLYQHLLMCFLSGIRDLEKLGRFGVLQAVVDLEFLRSCMVTMRSKASNKIIQKIYDSLKEATLDQSLWTGKDGPRSHVIAVIESQLQNDYLIFAFLKTLVFSDVEA